MTATCPNCEARFDAKAAAKRVNPACPECQATWGELHEAVDPQPDPEDAEIEYPFDGPGGVST